MGPSPTFLHSAIKGVTDVLGHKIVFIVFNGIGTLNVFAWAR